MAAVPSPFPPTSGPAQVPAGWRADWSAEHNTWYYLNLTTNVYQWNFPVEQAQASYSSPPVSPPVQQYIPAQQSQPVAPTPETSTIAAGGLLGVAGGLIARAIFKHEEDEEDEGKIQKPHFSFCKTDGSDSVNQQSSSGPSSWFSNITGGGNQPDYTPPAPVMGAAAGGLSNSLASQRPHGPPPTQYAAPQQYPTTQQYPPPQQYPTPQQHTAPQQQTGPQIAAPLYHTGNNPQLHIHCAAWSDQDVTHIIRRMITPNKSIDFVMDQLIDILGDPWPRVAKQFSILYSYGPRPWELVATKSNGGNFSLIPHEPLNKARMSFINQTSNSRIVAVVWGVGNGLEYGKGNVEKLKQIEETGEWEANENWVGFDNMIGPGKVGVCYYRAGNGEIKMAAAREGGTVRLPWNPLGRWN